MKRLMIVLLTGSTLAACAGADYDTGRRTLGGAAIGAAGGAAIGAIAGGAGKGAAIGAIAGGATGLLYDQAKKDNY